MRHSFKALAATALSAAFAVGCSGNPMAPSMGPSAVQPAAGSPFAIVGAGDSWTTLAAERIVSEPFTFTYDTCEEPVTATGTYVVLLNKSGSHAYFQQFRGVGLLSGEPYNLSATQLAQVPGNAQGASVTTDAFSIRLIGRGRASNATYHTVVHTTVVDGEPKVAFTHTRVHCN